MTQQAEVGIPPAAIRPDYTLDSLTHSIYETKPGALSVNIGQEASQLVTTSTGVYGLNSHVHATFSWNGSYWTRIGDHTSQIVVAGDKLYGLNGNAHAIFSWNGSSWTRIGDQASQMASADGRLYGLNGVNGTVYRYNGSPQNWTPLRANLAQIVSAGDRLFALTNSNEVLRYEPASDGWSSLRLQVSQVVSAGDRLFALTEGGQVLAYDIEKENWSTEAWTVIGDDMKQLATDADALVALKGYNETVYRYETVAGFTPGWNAIVQQVTQIGTDAGQLVVLNGRQRYADRYNGTNFSGGGWTRIANGVDEITGDAGLLVGRFGTAAQRHDGQGSWTFLGEEVSRVYTSSGLANAVNNQNYRRYRFDASGWTQLDSQGFREGDFVIEPDGQISRLSGGKRFPLLQSYLKRKSDLKRIAYRITAAQYFAIPMGDWLS